MGERALVKCSKFYQVLSSLKYPTEVAPEMLRRDERLGGARLSDCNVKISLRCAARS